MPVVRTLVRMDFNKTYDGVVVGVGAAGLRTALKLGRSRRSVLVIDPGEPGSNASAEHMHDYLGRECTRPSELLAIGREEVKRYDVELTGEVVARRALMAGTMLIYELILEETSAAVAEYRKEVA